jgi:hypothetical protein
MISISDYVRQVVDKIEEIGDPANMSKQEWETFLEYLMYELGCRLEAVETELADEE